MNEETETPKPADVAGRLDGLVMSPGDFLNGLRNLFPPPRHPQTKANLYALMLAYDSAPMWRKHICTIELRDDLSSMRHNAK